MKFFRRGRKVEQSGDAEADTTNERNSPAGRSDYDMRTANISNVRSQRDYEVDKHDEEYAIEQSNVNKQGQGLEVDEDYNLIIDGEPIYVVKQKRGYLSILFSLAQTVILFGMMIQCGVASMKINPMIGPNPDVLSTWGAKNSYNILYLNEYWRLFSPIMLHAGIFHLLCNVGVQLDTGAFFEREWGSFIWLIVYLSSAASGSILSVIVSPNTIGVGSSGAVCGLFGAKIAEALCRCKESTKTTAKELSHAILCEQFGSTLCTVILILVFSFIPLVDWAAHVGGLIGGFIVGLMIFSLGIKSRRWKVAFFIMGLVMSLVYYGMGILFMIQERKDDVAKEMEDVCAYYQAYFEDYECNCKVE